jgi:hypothetical protein
LLLGVVLDVEDVAVAGDAEEEEVEGGQEGSHSAPTARPLQAEVVLPTDLLRDYQPLSTLSEPSHHLPHCLPVEEDPTIELQSEDLP